MTTRMSARLRYGPPVTQLGQETVNALAFTLDQSVRADQGGRHIVCPSLRCFANETHREGSVAGSVNRVILVGNLGRHPEVCHTNDGMLIVNLSVATSERWQDHTTGDRRERTEWHRVVIFNERLGEVAQKYLQKGSKVYLEGQLQTRKWTDQSGQERHTTEVVLGRYRGELTMLDSARTPTSMARTDPPGDQSLGNGSHKDTTNPAIAKSVCEDNVQPTELCRTRKAAQASHPIQAPQSDDQLKKKPQEAYKSRNPTTKRTAKKKTKYWSPPVPKPSPSSSTSSRFARPWARFIDEPLGSREDFKKDSASNWSRSRRRD